MRTVSMLALLVFPAVLVAGAAGQQIASDSELANPSPEATKPEKAKAKNPPKPTRKVYRITITEFSSPVGADPSASASEIIDSFLQGMKSGEQSPQQIIRTTVIQGTKTQVHFGRRETIFNGKVQTIAGRVQNRSTEFVDVGTIVSVFADDDQNHVRLMLSYESSRFGPNPPEDQPPVINTSSIETTVRLLPNQPQLLGGLTSEQTTYVMISVE